MHVLIVVLHRPQEPTGVCRHAANLARCLAATATVDRITLVTGVWQQHYFQTDFLLDPTKIDILGVDIPNTSKSRNLWFLFKLPQLVAQIAPDLVHLSFPIPFIRRLFTCPIISTIHDLYPYKIPANFGRIAAGFNRLFLRQCIYASDGLACVSETTLADLLHYFPHLRAQPDRVRTIYNFVDFDRIEPTAPHKLAHRLDRPFVMAVGQHRHNKNFELLIRAYSRLRQTDRISPEIQLIIVGSPGPETEHLDRLRYDLGLEDTVVTIGSISDNELCWLYQHSRLMVVPSSLEGFCIPLVEALYFSCRVVCSDIPIFREIAADNCIYFDLTGAASENLANAIAIALETEITTTSDNCDRFTQQAIAIQLVNFYLHIS